MSPRGWGRLAAALVVAALAAGCHDEHDDGTTPSEKQADLPPFSFTDDTPNLLLTWIDEKGDAHVDMHPADVPMASRDEVRVVVADREEGTRDQFYVANLTKKEVDGSYATHTVSRGEWERLIEKRRAALLPPPPAPPPASSTAAPEASAPPVVEAAAAAVIIYGASWCGPCHQAEKYLKSKGIAYVMKDIDRDPGADQEMRKKLAKAGRNGGSIPVIDVRGEILVGFSASAIDRALARGATGTVL